MKKLILGLATCAACAIAAGQPMPPPHEGDRMDNHEMDRHEPDHPGMAHMEPPPQHHHRHKVWVPARHDDHGHMVPGHYIYR